LQDGEDLSGHYGLSGFAVDGMEAATGGSGHGDFHFHGFDEDDLLAGLELIAFLRVNAPDAAGA
jgi:hypothetical protein